MYASMATNTMTSGMLLLPWTESWPTEFLASDTTGWILWMDGWMTSDIYIRWILWDTCRGSDRLSCRPLGCRVNALGVVTQAATGLDSLFDGTLS